MSVDFTAAKKGENDEIWCSVFYKEWREPYLDVEIANFDEPPENIKYRPEVNMNLANANANRLLRGVLKITQAEDFFCGLMIITDAEALLAEWFSSHPKWDENYKIGDIISEECANSHYAERLMKIVELGKQMGATHIMWG